MSPLSDRDKSKINRMIAKRLNAIGLPAEEDLSAKGFLGLVDIEKGVIKYQPHANPSDILHEAGHLACLPKVIRDKANTDLSSVFNEFEAVIDQRIKQTGNTEDPLIRAIMQCSDTEATAWAWAMGKDLGIDEEVIILDGDYIDDNDSGGGKDIRFGLSVNCYAGINGLRAAGFIERTKDYPKMGKWLQEAK